MSVIDIAVIVSYFAMMAGMGFGFTRRNKDGDVFIMEVGKFD